MRGRYISDRKTGIEIFGTTPSHNDEALRLIMNALPYPSTFV
jgi:hypothetical protein